VKSGNTAAEEVVLKYPDTEKKEDPPVFCDLQTGGLRG